MDSDATFQASLDEDARRRFEAAWRSGRPEPIERFLPAPDHPHYLATLEELVHIDLEMRWKARGTVPDPNTATPAQPLVERYLERFPALNEPTIVRRLLRQESEARRRQGIPPPDDEYRARFPEVAAADESLPENKDTIASAPPLPRLAGYEVLGVLGRGGMGVVYKARQLRLNRLVAVKMVLGPGTAFSEDLVRFLIEAEAAARLQHPHIVQIHEVNRYEGGRPYLVMEFLEGGSLAEQLRRDGLPSPAEAARLVELLARAVDHAHRRGVVHRDLKPGNVLLTEDGTPKIADFGLARSAEGGTDLTRTGEILGTPSYMAPEQASGSSRAIGPAADIYGLGAVLYELLTGRPPFKAPTVLETLEQVRSRDPVPPARLRSGVPRDLETIALKCLHKEPSRRYPDAEELADDLKRFLEGRPILARPSSAWERARKWARRRPALAALLGVSIAAVVSLAIGGVWYNARLQDALEQTRRHETQARNQAEENRRQLVRLHVENGWRLVEEGDLWGSLLWFVEALRLDEGYPGESAHRLRLASLLRQKPVPMHVWFHEKALTAVAFSRDGRRVVTASRDRTARIWDVRTGRPHTRPLRHPQQVDAIAFSPDGKRLATGSRDLQARLWDATTGKQLGPPLNVTENVARVAFGRGGRHLLTVGRMWHGDATRGKVGIWDLETNRLVAEPFPLGPHLDSGAGHDATSPDGRRVFPTAGPWVGRVCDTLTRKPITEVLPGLGLTRHAEFSQDNRLLVTCSADGVARVWDADTGRLLLSPLRHPGGLVSAALDPNGRRFVTVGADKAVYVWDLRTGQPLAPPLRHAAPVSGAVFSADGRRLATTAEDASARVWDSATGHPLTPPLRHGWPGLTAVFSPDGRYLLTGSADGTARLWDLAAGAAPAPPPDSDAIVSGLEGLVLTGDGRLVLARRADGLAWVLDADTRIPVGGALHHPWGIHRGAFSPDGRRVALIGGHYARVWETATGKPLTPPLRHESWLPFASFSPDGRRLVTACMGTAKREGTSARIWDVDAGKQAGPWLPHLAGVQSALFSPDGARVVTASNDGTFRVWHAGTGEAITPPLESSGAWYAVFSPDGRRVLSSASGPPTIADGGAARIWDAASGTPLTPPMAHAKHVKYAAFGPDASRVVTASDDGTARVWDAASGAPLTPPLRHRGPVHHAAFSPDGRRVATASADGTARVWDAASGQALTPGLPHPGKVTQVLFRAKGAELVAACEQGPVRVWELRRDDRPVDDLKLMAEFLAGRRIDSTGSWVPLDGPALRRASDALRNRFPGEFAVSPELARGWRWQEVESSMHGQAWLDAARHLDALLKSEPRHRTFLKARADVEAELGRYHKAAEDYARLLALRTDHPLVPYLHGLARLGAGDAAAYRKACAALLHGLGRAPDAEQARFASWTCVLRGEAVSDVARVLRLAEQAAAAFPDRPFSIQILGAALYRAGRPEGAVQLLTRWNDRNRSSSDPHGWLFLAMAHHRLGRVEEARRWLERAARSIDQLPAPGSQTDRGALTWSFRLELELLRREAQTLLEGTDAGSR
jgi:WD40 repeat protein/serine/threonine protein kinase/tetratricopeptide (TPR) repeat protein